MPLFALEEESITSRCLCLLKTVVWMFFSYVVWAATTTTSLPIFFFFTFSHKKLLFLLCLLNMHFPQTHFKWLKNNFCRLDQILGRQGSKAKDVYESKQSLASRIVKTERQVKKKVKKSTTNVHKSVLLGRWYRGETGKVASNVRRRQEKDQSATSATLSPVLTHAKPIAEPSLWMWDRIGLQSPHQ